MTFSVQADQCLHCKHASWDSNHMKYICQKTGQSENHYGKCPDFDKGSSNLTQDINYDKRQKKLKELSLVQKEERNDQLMMVGGILVLIGFSWFTFVAIKFEKVMIYPIVMLVIGLIALGKGARRNKQK